MIEILYTVFWMAFCYYYANDTKNKYPEIDINPVLYIAGGFLFGVFSFIWCWNKKRVFNKYN